MTREPTAGTASGKSARSAQLPEAPGGHQLTDTTDSGAAAERGLVEDARRRILDLIGNQTLRPGDRVGTERELAARLSVSRSTLRQALAMLAQAGVLRRVPGRAGGTFVAAHAKVDRDLSLIVGLPEYLRRQGYVAGTQVLSATMAGADELTAAELALPVGGLVVDLVRIRLADRVPLSLERAQLPAGRFPGLLELPLGGSLYELLDSHYGIRPEDVIEHLEVVEASPEDAALLGIGAGAPLLAVTRTSSTSDGVPFEHSLDLFRADRTRVTFRTRAERAEIRRSDAGKPAYAGPVSAVDVAPRRRAPRPRSEMR